MDRLTHPRFRADGKKCHDLAERDKRQTRVVSSRYAFSLIAEAKSLKNRDVNVLLQRSAGPECLKSLIGAT